MSTDQEQAGLRRFVPKINPPEPINTSNETKEESFRRFKSQWTTYSLLSRVYNESEEYQSALLLYTVGPECQKVVESATNAPNTVEEILQVIEQYCCGDKNVIYERYMFNTRNQLATESFDDYYAVIRQKSNRCDYEAFRDQLVRDRLVWGIMDSGTRHKLIARGGTLTLEEAVQICRSEEVATQTVRQLSIAGPPANPPGQATEVNAISRAKGPTKPAPSRVSRGEQVSKCYYCGGSHARSKEACPAYG